MQRQAEKSRRESSPTLTSRAHDRDNELLERSHAGQPPDDEDAETELLRELAREVERSRSMRPAPADLPVPARQAPGPASEETRRELDPRMQVFLDGAPEPAIRRSAHLRVPRVDIDDLVEELATTAAALRARRAA